MSEVSVFRLYLMRGGYLLMAVGLAFFIWPHLIAHSDDWARRDGSTAALLGGISLMAALGLRYPLQMLPILVFELVWKVLYLLAITLPLWRAGQMDADMWENAQDCLLGVVIMPIVIPWPYVFARYLKAPTERWR